MSIRHYIPPIGWAVVIMILSSLPVDKLPAGASIGIDKIVHFVLFLLLAHMLVVAFKKQHKIYKLRAHSFTIAIIASVMYGILIEILQGTVFVSRSIELMDILADAAGASASIISFKFVYGNLNN